MEAIASAPADQQPKLRLMTDWAISLEKDGLVGLFTYHAKDGKRMTLLPRLKADDVGLVTIWRDTNSAYLQFWRSVFDRRAPNSLARVDRLLSPDQVRQGNSTAAVTSDLLAALTEAYREAAQGMIVR